MRILAHVGVLAGEIGARPSDSAGEARAVAYITEQLGAYGYHVEVTRFAFDDDTLQPGTVDLDETAIPGLTIAGSAAGRATGELVHVGLGDAAGFTGRPVRGKIAVAERSTPHLADAIRNARAGGAAALVVVNPWPGLWGGRFHPPEPLLVVEVGSAAGDPLRAAARAGRSATVEAAGSGRREALNVLARRPPAARCELLVGAHHDTVPASPGANDNASGTATVLELARALAAADAAGPAAARGGLCFATFGAEESWWHGSLALARRLQQEGALPRAMVNLDVTGIGGTVEVVGSPAVADAAVAAAAALGIPVAGPHAAESVNSDHRSFLGLGVPVLLLTSGAFATAHSSADVAAGLDPASLQRVGDLAFATLARLLEVLPGDEPRGGPPAA